MQVTIDVDLGPLAEEWEPVAYRLPKKGELLVYRHCVELADSDFKTDLHLIVRRKWIWPAWLKSRWYAEDLNGSQWAYKGDKTPEIRSDCWATPNVPAAQLDTWFNIPKIGGDWRQSLRENPNWKGSQ